MRTRINQIWIQVLLMLVITAIVAFTCMNLAELVDMFSDAAGEALVRFSLRM